MTPQAQVTALLCCALGEDVAPLTALQAGQLLRRMQDAGVTGLPRTVGAAELAALGFSAEFSARAAALLSRPDALRRYTARNAPLTVLAADEPGFPARLLRLGAQCPPVLFCRGDAALLQTRCIALVGSRNASPGALRFARRIGALCAAEGLTLVSGNAAGADRAAQDACLQGGGSVVSFVPDALCRHAQAERRLFVSEHGADVPFSAARALSRNRLIHALGAAAVVAACTPERGGSWSGARENLRRGLSRLCVPDDDSPGSLALLALGATPIPENVRSIGKYAVTELSIFD